jgi:tRNA pseudouridine55 synthase
VSEPAGVLVVDKPAGPTSHAVVARVRRATGVARVGHTGTLDPFATGVLALVLGRATRLAQFVAAGEKEYVAEIRLGRVTDTYDRTGIFAEAAVSARAIGRSEVDSALAAFRGTFSQRPPPYSAKKVKGIRAYDLARQAITPDLKAVEVTVHRLELLEFQPGSWESPDPDRAPLVRLRLATSAGFYVRSLAHDLGLRLGCGAWLHGLRRLRSGDFTLAEATPLETVEQRGREALDRLCPLERLLPNLPGVVLNDVGVRRALHGNDLAPEHLAQPSGVPEARRVRLLDERGRLLGIAEPAPGGGLLHPVVVLM